MSLFDQKFSLLTIEAFQYGYDSASKGSSIGKMEACFNPGSLQLNYQTEFVHRDAINKTSLGNQFVGPRPGNLSIELLFGDTVRAGEEQVQDLVDGLKNLCTGTHTEYGSTYLVLSWGDMKWGGKKSFTGHMTSMSVRYTRFSRHGLPLRATVSLQLVANDSLDKTATETPKLPQGRVLKAMESETLSTLLLQTSAAAVLTVTSLAVANDLDTLGPPSAGDNFLSGKA